MPLEDKSLAMRVRRSIAKVEVDIALMEIYSRNGVVHLSGTLRRPRGYHGVLDLQSQLDHIIEIIKHIPGVHDVSSMVRIE